MVCSTAVHIMLAVERVLMCQLAFPWGTRHLISPELAGKDIMMIHSLIYITWMLLD